MSWAIVTTSLRHESDLVVVRQRAKRISELLGFDAQDQTRLATAVSEIARNAITDSDGGQAEFLIAGSPANTFLVRIRDRGHGLSKIQEFLDGRLPLTPSTASIGLGITGARRLVDHFEIRSSYEGISVELGKPLPASSAGMAHAQVIAITNQLTRDRGDDPMIAWREQSQELLQSLNDARERQEELVRLNRELEDTNRGVVALYAELDERAEQLRRANELKTRFLSNVSHELRTPLNSILALSRLLIERVDGDLTAEQERQVSYIRNSATSLVEMVNDLLDLAKVEAGRIELKPELFTVADLFTGLRGAFKPLLTSTEVELIFEVADDLPLMWTDEAKLAQILRNFISNALKFTERGVVWVQATHDPRTGRNVFSVRDTGIGIAPADQERIFEEFVQIESRLQVRSKGTGLGLPLSRKLAEVLGGEIWVASEPGKGSTFFLAIPPDPAAVNVLTGEPMPLAQTKRILVVDDDESYRYALRQFLSVEPQLHVDEAANGEEALSKITGSKPDLIVLDLQMPVLDGFAVLEALSQEEKTRNIPVIVSTSQSIDAALRARLSRAALVASKEVLWKKSIIQIVRRTLCE